MINRCLTRLALTTTLFLAAISFSSYAQADSDKIFLQEMVTMLDLVEKDASYWPGFNINSKPIVLSLCHENYDQQTGNQQGSCGLYAFNFKPNSNNWQKLSVDDHDVYYSATDPYGITKKDNNYYSNYEPYANSLDLIKKPYTMIDGQLASVLTITFNPYGSNTEMLQNALMVLGNRLQAHMLTDAPNAEARIKLALQRMHAGYTGFRDTTNVALLYLETKLMKSYAKRPNEETLKNFVAIENIRKAAATPEMLSYEYSNSAAFGIYPVAHMTGQSANVLDSVWMEPLNDANVSSSYFSSLNYTNTMIAFISMTGTVALENIDASWKTTANAQLISTQELLMDHYKMPQDEINRRVNAVKLTYDFDAVKKRLDAAPTLAGAEAELKKYQEMPGVVTHVVLPDNTYIYSDYAVDSETTLSVIQDGSGSGFGNPLIFSYNSLKYLKVQKDVEADTVLAEFKLASDATITIDGVKTTVANLLAAKQKTPFKLIEAVKSNGTASYYDTKVMVSSDNGGIIDATNGSTLEITR